MRLDLYLAETRRMAQQQADLLDIARKTLQAGQPLSDLEKSGTLHALQLLIENAIGKAKQLLKAAERPVPVSAYDAMRSLAELHAIDSQELNEWNAVIGLRNRIVHEYMDLDINRVLRFVEEGRHEFVMTFLLTPPPKDLST